MKEHNKHSIDQKLEKKFSDYKESPSDELWGRIKHEMDASSGNSSEELNGKKGGFKPYSKPFFWVGAAIVTASVLFYSVNLGKENVAHLNKCTVCNKAYLQKLKENTKLKQLFKSLYLDHNKR